MEMLLTLNGIYDDQRFCIYTDSMIRDLSILSIFQILDAGLNSFI